MAAQETQLEIRVLSGFAYRRTGASWRPVRAGLAGELLYLLVVGGPVEADALCQALWPGAPQRWATGRLVDVRARARRDIGDVFVKDENGWSLSAALTVCDLWDVQTRLRQLLCAERRSATRRLTELLRRHPGAMDAPITSPVWGTAATERARERAQAQLDALRRDVTEYLSYAEDVADGGRQT